MKFSKRLMCHVLTCLTIMVTIQTCNGENKYSSEANAPSNFRNLQKPFRMAKLNILWSKAQVRLTEPKLKSLYSELKIHDKEELTWKKLKADGLDKEGTQEAILRKRLTGIMSTYGLLEHFEDVANPQKYSEGGDPLNEASDDYINKSLFKDKKLSKLWHKAEHSGFTSEELLALKEEFNHHQEKIDQYYSILKDVESGPGDNAVNSIDNTLERFNTLEEQDAPVPNKDYLHKANALRDQHRTIRDGYDRLQRLAAKGPNSKDFIEPKVQGLWKIATETNFSVDELESLRVELLHYENRLLKLRHLQAEAALNNERKTAKVTGDKLDGLLLVEETIKKHARKVDKLHLDLETRIMQRHIEL